MYDPSVTAPDGTKLTIQANGESRTVDLYSREGLEVLASLWIKSAAHHRLLYEHSWMGIPIIQFPETVVALQELIWKLRPDVIVECGLAHGGSAILYASICEIIGHGRVVGVDVDIRKYNRVALQSHALADRLVLIEGSSVDPATVERVNEQCRSSQTTLVILDSNHSYDHVRQELEAYHRLVTPGSYLVVMDGVQAHVWEVPGGKEEWKQDNPLRATHDFLKEHAEFEIDPYYTRGLITSCPDGFLRKRKDEHERHRQSGS